MKKIQIFCAVTLCLSALLSACAEGYQITTRSIPLQIGETTVELVVHESAAAGLSYLNLHDNENTSVKAALDAISQSGGRLFELKHSGTRNIVFYLAGVKYEFDPNRMFTELGRQTTLERFGTVNDSAMKEVEVFAESLIREIDPAELGYIITLHNNTRSGYSVLSYTEAGEYAAEASLVSVSLDIDPDDFFFITDPILYDELQALGLNVVLQDNENMTDDGSLSVWSGLNQVPYVNIEAQYGHRKSQTEMLGYLNGILPLEKLK